MKKSELWYVALIQHTKSCVISCFPVYKINATDNYILPSPWTPFTPLSQCKHGIVKYFNLIISPTQQSNSTGLICWKMYSGISFAELYFTPETEWSMFVTYNINILTCSSNNAYVSPVVRNFGSN